MPEQEPLLPQEIEVSNAPIWCKFSTEPFKFIINNELHGEEDFGPPVYLIDGVAKPAKWKVNGKYCYELDDLDRRINQLGKDGVKYTVEEVVPPPRLYISDGVKYANVDEALKHMANAEPPESMIIPYLKEKIKANEDWLAAALTKITEIETVKMVELSDKVRVLEEASIEPVIKEETIIKR